METDKESGEKKASEKARKGDGDEAPPVVGRPDEVDSETPGSSTNVVVEAVDVSSENPGSSGTTIKKRVSSRSHRNYRNSLENLAKTLLDESSESSSDEDKSCVGCGKPSGKRRRSNNEGSATPEPEHDAERPEVDVHEGHSNGSLDVAMSIGHGTPEDGPHDEDDNLSDQSSSSSSSEWRRLPAAESSDSSDCVLEDLDEGYTANDNENEEETTTKSPTAAKKKKIGVEIPQVLLKPKPQYNWCGPKELFMRELGYGSKKEIQSARIFRSAFNGSVYSVERLELMRKLDGHHGCVNCLNFNYAGTKLASGSDDLFIKIWNYASGQVLSSFHSGHRANVFQAKFMPLIGLEDTRIVSCARDNQVRLSELKPDGQVWCSKKLAQHKGAAHKLSISPESPHVIMSAGEDGFVFSIDIREDDKFQRLLQVRDDSGKKVPLYSIHQNPMNCHEFCVAGRDQYVRIYDARKVSSVTANASQSWRSEPQASAEAATNVQHPVKKFCPHSMVENNHRHNVTAAVYSYNGEELVATYNDDNIYLFDATHSDGADYIKSYEGHRNNSTIKGINFFGDKSQFIVSGSDCGHVYLWEKETESLVNFLLGDENGIVNVLEPHPTAPILATSGLDDDVKIWVPTKDTEPNIKHTNLDLVKTINNNVKGRKESLESLPDSMDGRIFQALWRHIRLAHRNRRRRAGNGEGSDEESDDTIDTDVEDEEEEVDDDDRGSPQGIECVIS